jgi:hypothetical protein
MDILRGLVLVTVISDLRAGLVALEARRRGDDVGVEAARCGRGEREAVR